VPVVRSNTLADERGERAWWACRSILEYSVVITNLLWSILVNVMADSILGTIDVLVVESLLNIARRQRLVCEEIYNSYYTFGSVEVLLVRHYLRRISR